MKVDASGVTLPDLNLLTGEEWTELKRGDSGRSSHGCPLSIKELSAHCRAALAKQQLLDFAGIEQIEVSLQMLTSEAMRSLNAQYRQKDAPTNVLSFESGLPVLHDENTGSLQVLGDLIFCPQVIASEASAQNKPLDAHWAHLVVHGTLHLCGYDHINAEEASNMESLEITILSKTGIANPYLSCVLND